jgi:hypothetical protein
LKEAQEKREVQAAQEEEGGEEEEGEGDRGVDRGLVGACRWDDPG